MSYQVDVSFPGLTCTIELDTKAMEGSVPGFRRYVWRVHKPIPTNIRALVGDSGIGTWTKSSVGFSLYKESNWKDVFMELRQKGNDNPNGPAFAVPRGTAYTWEGSWAASSVNLPKTWVGIMGKGSAGLGIGVEGGITALSSLDFANHGVCLSFGAGRVIAGGGFSGGLALVIATGFETASSFDGWVGTGGDWALSIGENLKSIVSCGRLAKLKPILKALSTIDETVGTLDKYSKAVSSGEHSKEIYGVVKGALQGTWVDTDTKNLTAIDLPLASAGAEAGIYYSWSRYKLLKRW